MRKEDREAFAIGVDIGGTSIRSALVSGRGAIRRGSLRVAPVDSKGTKESILESFALPLRENLDQAGAEGLRVVAIGVGMCGPLDYDKGICRIRGVDKYESLYQLNLKEELRDRLRLLDQLPFEFEVDAWSFGRGEVWRGSGRGFRRVVALTIGSGLGSAFLVDGIPVGRGPGVPPPFGWLGGLRWKNGILDDRVSRRGIRARFQSLAVREGDALNDWDVKEIAEAARSGNRLCARVLEETGETLGKTIAASLRKFQTERLILGGRIGQAFSLFEESLGRQIRDIRTLEKVLPARSIRYSALWGAAKMAFSRTLDNPDR